MSDQRVQFDWLTKEIKVLTESEDAQDDRCDNPLCMYCGVNR